MTERNSELFYEVADQIRKEPSSYIQSIWGAQGDPLLPCRTAACIAGWATILSGQAIWQERDKVFELHCDIHPIAAEALGLTPDEAARLFSPVWRPREDLTVEEALEKLAAGADLDEVSEQRDPSWPSWGNARIA